jgi:LuxR family transcriptional regulator, maltose regulon positive regulatory protein
MEHSSDVLLLTTKLKIPAPRKNYIVRQALFEKLSLCADMNITFISGGAGTGKTTLLSSFLKEKRLKKVCWMSLDAANTNVYSFWLYFTAAVSSFLEEDGSLLQLMRMNSEASHMENILITLINRLWGEEDYYMVLDDIHCIRDAALIKTFEFFIGAMPANFHFFLLSREDPPVYLGPLAVSGRLLFIDSKQMQLSMEEGLAFLKNTMKLEDSEEELNQLNSYAEGWIGGLQLAAAAKAAGKYSGQLLRAGGGIASEYLTREIIAALTEKERDFLTKTGYLSYFDADICKKLFQNFTEPEFKQMMEGLIEKNLFVICLDDERGVYRYHNILSEYLTQQFLSLPETQKAELYQTTARAFEEKGDYEEALREYCEAGNYDEALGVARLMEGKLEAWNYLNQVPLELLAKDADLTAQCFIYNIGNLNLERCRLIYDKYRELYGDSDIFNIVSFAEVYFKQGGGVLPQYTALTAEQIEHIPFGPVAKAMLLIENAAALVEVMKYDEAEKCILKGIQTASDSNAFISFFAYNQLGQVYEEVGRLNDSLLCYAKSKEKLKSLEMLMCVETNYHFGLAGVYLRRMELDEAKVILEQARNLLEKQHIRIDITDMTLIYHLAEMSFLCGENDTAASYVEDMIAQYPNYSILTLARLIYELECTEKLLDSLGNNFLKELETAENYRIQPFMRILRARLLFKRGEIEEAFKETDDVLTFSRLQHNKLRLVEAGIVKIYMLLQGENKTGSQREINNLLLEALHYAREDRILMPFYLDRKTLLPVLRELSAQAGKKNLMSPQEMEFLRHTIEICEDQDSKTSKSELLSAREYEVLKELAQGITNREIAEKLCISQATVKTHVLSIYGKLGVSSRMLAVDKARKDGLI